MTKSFEHGLLVVLMQMLIICEIASGYISRIYHKQPGSSSGVASKLTSVRGFSRFCGSNVNNPVSSDEEALTLSRSIDNGGFLKNIIEYGKNRMARRAVGILSKMPSYRIMPRIEHYNAALWACMNSDMFELGVSVFDEMKSNDITYTLQSYEAIIELAEKTGHWEDALSYLNIMTASDTIKGSTKLFNACIWATEKGGKYEIALQLLDRMEKEDITRDADTYAACLYACESCGEGATALHVFDLMKRESITIDTFMYKAAMWSCVKSGMWQDAIRIFDLMEAEAVAKNEDCFNAAIWAYKLGGNAKKSVELLTAMKLDGLTRSTIAFDGAISALQENGDWKACIDVLSWMDREVKGEVRKSSVTYNTIITALDIAEQSELGMEIYLRALRDGYFNPWIGGTRLIDVSHFSFPVAKFAVHNILLSIKKGKLSLFDLNIIVAKSADEGSDRLVEDMVQFLVSLSLLEGHQLLVEKRIEDGYSKLHIKRDSLAEFITFRVF